jgi:hypothetical protein
MAIASPFAALISSTILWAFAMGTYFLIGVLIEWIKLDFKLTTG